VDRLRLKPIDPDSRTLVESLWQLYKHDLSEFLGTKPEADGKFRPGRLPSYFEDPDRCGYLIYADQELLGFAMLLGIGKPPVVMGDFFILRAFRRTGIGSMAANLVMQTHPDPWEIPFQINNSGAAKFWRTVAESRAPGGWSEERRPVPGKPEVPPDAWISFTSSGATAPN
jgi:predicted acetyltransferase